MKNEDKTESEEKRKTADSASSATTESIESFLSDHLLQQFNQVHANQVDDLTKCISNRAGQASRRTLTMVLGISDIAKCYVFHCNGINNGTSCDRIIASDRTGGYCEKAWLGRNCSNDGQNGRVRSKYCIDKQ